MLTLIVDGFFTISTLVQSFSISELINFLFSLFLRNILLSSVFAFFIILWVIHLFKMLTNINS